MTIGALRYRDSGVDISVSNEAKARIAKLVTSTHTGGVLGGFGGFGGMFRAPPGMRKPVLVSSADGVGTKIRVAIEAGRHSTIGHDLVNHCVNDILTQGAAPLFFLDYVAFGELDPSVVEEIVAGIAAGCKENECALVGGETAEMPGIYTPPDYDLAGFIVGSVEEDEIKGSHNVLEGDQLVAMLDDIIDYSRIGHGRLELDSTEVELLPVVHGVASLFASRAFDKGVRLRVSIDPITPTWVIGDPTRLRQIDAQRIGR